MKKGHVHRHIHTLKTFTRENWISFIVLVIALGASISSTVISFSYANDSISHLTSQILVSVSTSIKNDIETYLNNQTTTVLPFISNIFSSRLVNTTNSNTKDLDLLIQYMFSYSEVTLPYSMFVVNTDGNDVGITRDNGTIQLSLLWQGFVSNFSFWLMDK